MMGLQWAADLKTKQGTIRAEYTYEQQFNCDSQRVRDAFEEAMINNAWFRPLNVALGSDRISLDVPQSVAAFVVRTFAADEIEHLTFYGTGYLYLDPDEEPNTPEHALYPDIDDESPKEIDLMIPTLPPSRFGFRPPTEGDASHKALAKEWDESEHPRGAGGRFGSVKGGSSRQCE